MSAEITASVDEVTITDNNTGYVDVVVPYFDFDDEPTDDIEFRVTVTASGIQVVRYSPDDEDEEVDLPWDEILGGDDE